jgi:hypothetical protein
VKKSVSERRNGGERERRTFTPEQSDPLIRRCELVHPFLHRSLRQVDLVAPYAQSNVPSSDRRRSRIVYTCVASMPELEQPADGGTGGTEDEGKRAGFAFAVGREDEGRRRGSDRTVDGGGG